MTRRLIVLVLLCSLAAITASCGSSPSSRFYTLNPTTAPATAASSVSMAVGPVSVPAVVDRPQMVVSTGANELSLDEFNRWASPLQDNLARVVAENLVAMLGTPRVTLFPQTLSTDAEYRVAIEVQSFESVPGKSATLDAVWTLRRAKDGRSETRRTTAHEKPQDNSYDALAAAHSRAVARLSQDIADAVRGLSTAQ
jgi:uncharacterized lipoprotein YmbA